MFSFHPLAFLRVLTLHHLNLWMAKFRTDLHLQSIMFKNWSKSTSLQWYKKVISFFILQCNEEEEAFSRTLSLFCLMLSGLTHTLERFGGGGDCLRESRWALTKNQSQQQGYQIFLARLWLTKHFQTRGLKSPPLPVTSSLISGSSRLVPWGTCVLFSSLSSAIGYWFVKWRWTVPRSSGSASTPSTRWRRKTTETLAWSFSTTARWSNTTLC